MGKIKYQFNTKSLRIEKVHIGFKQRIKQFLYVVSAGIVFATIVIILAYNFLDSPKERILQRENKQYELQYKILSKRLNDMQKVISDLQNRDENIYRIIFEVDSIPTEIRKAGFGGSDRYSGLNGYNNENVIKDIAQRVDIMTSQLYVQSKSLDEIYELALRKEELLASIPAIQPVSIKDMRQISSHFGYRTDPFYKVQKLHTGIDFSTLQGKHVYCTGNGVVESVERSNRGYGNTVIVNHGFGYKTLYAHLHEIKVTNGKKLNRGDIIGSVGNTGKSTSPHLHYEVIKNNKHINPIDFFFNDISSKQYLEIIEMSKLPSQSMD